MNSHQHLLDLFKPTGLTESHTGLTEASKFATTRLITKPDMAEIKKAFRFESMNADDDEGVLMFEVKDEDDAEDAADFIVGLMKKHHSAVSADVDGEWITVTI